MDTEQNQKTHNIYTFIYILSHFAISLFQTLLNWEFIFAKHSTHFIILLKHWCQAVLVFLVRPTFSLWPQTAFCRWQLPCHLCNMTVSSFCNFLYPQHWQTHSSAQRPDSGALLKASIRQLKRAFQMHFLTGIPSKYWHSPSWCCNTVTSITRCNIRTVKHDRGRKDDLKKKLMQNALFSFSPRRCICGIIAFMHTHSIWSMNLVHTLVLLSKKKNEKRRWENACLALVLGGMNQTLTAVPHSLTHIHTFTHRHSTWKALGIISDSDGSSNSQSEILLSKTQPKNIETGPASEHLWGHHQCVSLLASPSLSPSYWTIFILIYLYLYMEYLYIIFYLLTLMTIWHTCYLYISIWPTETKWSLKHPKRPTDTLDQQQQPGYLHSFPLTSWKHLFFKKQLY